ncbi:MAG: hypothetical protein H6839_06385 [Planctomycetes bacterium]|nr:hypothetical protein [Planctomycetota bacterium]
MRWLPILLLFLAGCASTQSDESAAELEGYMVRTGTADRQDVAEPAGWYWLITNESELTEALGAATIEFETTGDKATPTRLFGYSGDSLREFDDDPPALDWLSEQELLMVAFERNAPTLSEKAKLVEWGPPVLTADDEVVLGQTAFYEADVTTASIYARRYKDGSRTRVAWWGYRESTKRKQLTLVRMRYFDETSVEWPAIQRAIERAGSTDDKVWPLRAGIAAFDELGLSWE